MTVVYDVPPTELLVAVAKKLQKIESIKPPEWAPFVKTGVHRESAPENDDWWYVRTAALLRKIYIRGPIGVERLRALFGGNVDRGSKPSHARGGSGSIVREAIQQLENAGLVAKMKDKGRVVTPEGQRLLDNTAHEVKHRLLAQIPELGKY